MARFRSFPVDLPVHEQAVTGEKDRAAELAFGQVVAGVDADDFLDDICRLLQFVLMYDVEIVIRGVIFGIGVTADGNTGDIQPRAVQHALVVGDDIRKCAFAELAAALLEHVLADLIERGVVLAGVLERKRVVVAGHLDENPALDGWNQVFVVRQPGNRANRLWPKPEAHVHRAGRERVGRQPPRHLDGCHHARSVVIGLVGVADVRHDENLACRGFGAALGVNQRRRYLESTLGRIGQKL